jgi:hypothetical protein
MEPSTPIEQPQRVRKVWSHKVVGNVTLLIMIILVVLGWPPFNLSLSMSSALALGAFAGFVVAAINWFRLGRRWKALFHLLISPLIYLVFLACIPLLLAEILLALSGGSTERATELSQGNFASILAVALYFGAAFLVIAYLYSMTKHDIAHLQAKGITVKYADFYAAFLPPMGIAALSVIFMWVILTVAGQAYIASKQNHVYCELLQPGMTEEEVSRMLDEIGPHAQARGDGFFPLPKGVSYYRNIYWRDGDIEWNYHLWLWVGYDKDGKLVWKGRSTLPGMTAIECPWTFSQSVMAR